MKRFPQEANLRHSFINIYGCVGEFNKQNDKSPPPTPKKISCSNTLAHRTFIHIMDQSADGNASVTHKIRTSTAYRKEMHTPLWY